MFELGDELIRITLETYSLQVEFYSGTIEIEAPFLLTDAAGKTHAFDPRTHDGDPRPLWDLIGANLRESALGMTDVDTLTFTFENGAILAIPPLTIPGRAGGSRGTILGKDDDKLIMYDY